VRASVDKYGHALITADYRFAPQVGVPEIFEDVKACIKFIRSPTGLKINALDTSRLAVAGNSAGGYLALLAGLYVEPKPQCVLAMYPITDPFGTCFIDALCVPEGRARVDDASVHDILFSNAVVANSAPTSARSMLFHHSIDNSHHSLFPEHMGLYIGQDALHYEGNDYWRIAKSIEVNWLPPTFIWHGTGDTVVEVGQSDEVVGAMAGEETQFVYKRYPGRGHLFAMDRGIHMVPFYDFLGVHL
jgi:acetyl esterase/lipase